MKYAHDFVVIYFNVIMTWVPRGYTSLQCRHNEWDGVSNQRRLDCLLGRLFRRRTKHQSSASLAFVRGIHRWPVDTLHKGSVTRKMFPFDYAIMWCIYSYFQVCFMGVGPIVRLLRFQYIDTWKSTDTKKQKQNKNKNKETKQNNKALTISISYLDDCNLSVWWPRWLFYHKWHKNNWRFLNEYIEIIVGFQGYSVCCYW